ncbi:helix-turn-helix domain-containing protein [Pseudosulfitobacter pseudonitzschiae]|uniref:helix-turn-helix domain-containing protein n=1 Tax=Pseudosulfitobacter pseudonitzschiae TaxID=1402135 RepID=UPI003B7A07AA
MMSSRSGKETESRTAFGCKLSEYIDRYATSRSDLASRMGTSRAYVSGLTTGTKHASARTAEDIAETLGVSPAEKIELHRAAALDAGFKLELPKDF